MTPPDPVRFPLLSAAAEHTEEGRRTLQLSIGAGWYSLVEELLLTLKAHGIKSRPSTIKEKFGGLRFYLDFYFEDNEDDIRLAHAFIDKAASSSYLICDVCGESGRLRKDGWFRARCDAHVEGIER